MIVRPERKSSTVALSLMSPSETVPAVASPLEASMPRLKLPPLEYPAPAPRLTAPELPLSSALVLTVWSPATITAPPPLKARSGASGVKSVSSVIAPPEKVRSPPAALRVTLLTWLPMSVAVSSRSEKLLSRTLPPPVLTVRSH